MTRPWRLPGGWRTANGIIWVWDISQQVSGDPCVRMLEMEAWAWSFTSAKLYLTHKYCTFSIIYFWNKFLSISISVCIYTCIYSVCKHERIMRTILKKDKNQWWGERTRKNNRVTMVKIHAILEWKCDTHHFEHKIDTNTEESNSCGCKRFEGSTNQLTSKWTKVCVLILRFLVLWK